MSKSEMVFVPCGIEVSSRTLIVDLRERGVRNFPNTPGGHRSLSAWLRRGQLPLQVCMEATGLYGLDLALELDAAGIPLMVANPRSVRNFARAMMQRSKTDRLDAAVLREYAARMPCKPWRRPSPQALKLTAVTHRIEALTHMIAAEKNRLHAASLSRALPELVRRDLARSIQSLERARQRLIRAAEEFVLGDPRLARCNELLLSVLGIGARSALHLLGELQRFAPDCNVRQWVAGAGLDPRQHTSGTSVAKKPAVSKTGNARLRHALFMPALVASQHEPHLRGFYEHLLARGKAKLQALVAVMRKLLHAIFGMFKHDQPFEGSKVFTLKSQPEAACA